MALELLGPYVGHVHIGGRAPRSNGLQPDGARIWKWEGASMAEGLLDVKQAVRDLKAVGYDKFLSVEDFRDIPVEDKLTEDLTYLRAVIASA